jgi:hypothetical protein
MNPASSVEPVSAEGPEQLMINITAIAENGNKALFINDFLISAVDFLF